MKELLDKVLEIIPVYVAQLIDVIAGPKRFISRLDMEKDNALQEALLFFGFSLLICHVIQIPLLNKGSDPLLSFAQMVALELVIMLLIVILLKVSWAMVGGTASFRSLLICSAYILVPMLFCFIFFVLSGDAFFRMLDPDLYDAVRGNTLKDPSILLSSTGFKGYLLLLGTGLVIVSAQYVVAWGAYRILNGTNKLRSAIAFLTSTLLSIPLTVITFVLSWHLHTALSA